MAMRLLEKLDALSAKSDEEVPAEKVLTHKLSQELLKLCQFKSLSQLKKSDQFLALQSEISSIVFGYEYGCYVEQAKASKKPFHRAVLWHLENGVNFEGILDSLKNRALIGKADIYFFPATDIGMGRSGNRNVIRDLAIELGYNYFFATSYLNLHSAKSSPDQPDNTLGLEGNAIMTRYPMSHLRTIPLPVDHDAFHPDRKRLGTEKALVADLLIDKKSKITIVCLNLPVHLSARQRAKNIRFVLDKLKKEKNPYPILIGGDFKTSTYNCRSPLAYLLSVLNKQYRGFEYIIKEHHKNPEKHFEKHLFDAFRSRGFDFTSLNEMGQGSVHFLPQNLMPLPDQYLKLVGKLLKGYPDKLAYKYDWFAGTSQIQVSESHQAERPKVISHLIKEGRPVSYHDPVLLDFEVAQPSVSPQKK